MEHKFIITRLKDNKLNIKHISEDFKSKYNINNNFLYEYNYLDLVSCKKVNNLNYIPPLKINIDKNCNHYLYPVSLNNIIYYIIIESNSADKSYYKLFKKYSNLSENSIIITDNNWDIEYTNSTFADKTGYSKKEILGSNINSYLFIDSEAYDIIKNNYMNKNHFKHYITNQSKSGEIYKSEQIVTPILYKNNLKFIIIQKDISKKQLKEEIISVLNRILRHNLRTSINVIEGYVESLDNSETYSEQQHSISIIQNRISEMKEISKKTKKIKKIINHYDDSENLPVEQIENIISSYRKRNTIIALNTNNLDDYSIMNKNLFIMVFKELIQQSLKNNTNRVSRIDIKLYPTKNNVLKIIYEDNSKKYSSSSWEIIKKGSETPLNHINGIELWIIYWSIKAMGGQIKLIDDLESGKNKFIIHIPAIIN